MLHQSLVFLNVCLSSYVEYIQHQNGTRDFQIIDLEPTMLSRSSMPRIRRSNNILRMTYNPKLWIVALDPSHQI